MLLTALRAEISLTLTAFNSCQQLWQLQQVRLSWFFTKSGLASNWQGKAMFGLGTDKNKWFASKLWRFGIRTFSNWQSLVSSLFSNRSWQSINILSLPEVSALYIAEFGHILGNNLLGLKDCGSTVYYKRSLDELSYFGRILGRGGWSSMPRTCLSKAKE